MDTDTCRDYWDTCSFGKMRINRPNFRVINVTVPCASSGMVSACDWNTIGKLADTEASNQLGAGGHSWGQVGWASSGHELGGWAGADYGDL